MLGELGIFLARPDRGLTTDDVIAVGQRGKQVGKAIGGLLGIGTVSLVVAERRGREGGL